MRLRRALALAALSLQLLAPLSLAESQEGTATDTAYLSQGAEGKSGEGADHTWHAGTTEQQPSRTYQHRQQPAIKGKNPFFNFKLHSDYCQAWTPPDRLVVVAAAKYDSDWLEDYNLQHVLYQHRDPQEPFWYPNAANEAGAYLQFILDHYHCLPKVVAFVHGHRYESWHSADMTHVLPNLRWDDVTYTDINRKMPTWPIAVGALPKERSTLLGDDRILATGADVFNGSYHPLQVVSGKAYEVEAVRLWVDYTAFSRAYDKFFGFYGLGPMPDWVHYVCCAQFAVSADRMRGRPLSFYQAMRDYMLDNDLQKGSVNEKKYTVGDAFNLYWPMIFGESNHYELQDECNIFWCDPNTPSNGVWRKKGRHSTWGEG